jgi:2-(1,2-epoxy-1,2-dihydrophenyl)acetyl-CoA isomerase
MTEQYVRLETDGEIARITLARPERHNALVPELLDGLLGALKECHRFAPRTVILQAEGPSFSSGGDVGAFFETPRSERKAFASEVVGRLNQVIIAMLELPSPTIAAVHGLVTGGSIGLVLASDIVVATEKATFTPWYTVVGFSPDGGWSTLMGQRIGPSRALEMQLTNRSLSAEKALEYGLAHYLTQPAEISAKVQELCQSVVNKKPESVQRTLSMNRPDPKATAVQLQNEYEQFLEQIVTDEAHYGMASFLKRAP